MSGTLNLLNGELGKAIISGVSGSTGIDENKTNSVLTMALPVLMAAMKRNAATPEGANVLIGALNSKHDGSILDNLSGLFSGGVDDNIRQDGDKILGHVLGDKRQGVEKVLGKKFGLDRASIDTILKVAAPILMGVLGKRSKQYNVSSSSDLEGLLGGLLGANNPQEEQNFIDKILDADGDGSVIDDISGMVLGKAGGSKSELVSLLGGLFGK
ncbi:MAG: hypothetical protein ACJA1H_001618 [Glaciecola sp.]|jgi:hypothetical protein